MKTENKSVRDRACYLIDAAIKEFTASCGSADKIQLLLSEAMKVLSEPEPRVGRNGAFQPPTIDEALLNGAKIGLPQNECLKFHSYYEANGWKVGRNGMKSWTAAMIHWRGNWQERSGPGSGVRQPAGGSYRTIADEAVKQINNFRTPQ